MTVRCARGPGPTPAPAPPRGTAVDQGVRGGRGGAVGGGGALAATKLLQGPVLAGLPPRAAAPSPGTPAQCPLSTGVIDTSLIPWPGMRFACVRVLELYCKVFNQMELYRLIIR